LKQLNARVLSNEQVLRYPGAVYFLMQIEADAIAGEGRPGQFLMLKCDNNSLLRRPLSIHGVSPGGQVRLLYRVVTDAAGGAEGRGTGWLSHLREGDSVDVIGPLGNGFSVAAKSGKLLLVAGGIGIAPLSFLAEKSVNEGREVVLLMGARSAAGMLTQNMLPSGVNCVFTTDDGSAGKKGPVTEILPDYMDRADQVLRAAGHAGEDGVPTRRRLPAGAGFVGGAHGLRERGLLRLQHQDRERDEEGLQGRPCFRYKGYNMAGG
jgi:NAD(P)H-flavin reductase